jgi:hypothetical protein
VGVEIYSGEYKDGVVKQVLECVHTQNGVAKRLGVSWMSVYNWLCECGGRSRASKKAESIDDLKGEVAHFMAEPIPVLLSSLTLLPTGQALRGVCIENHFFSLYSRRHMLAFAFQ